MTVYAHSLQVSNAKTSKAKCHIGHFIPEVIKKGEKKLVIVDTFSNWQSSYCKPCSIDFLTNQIREARQLLKEIKK